ncbi:MAG: pantetheine-phosphate adenylyltransferase, partial [Burkholderiales bacterium]|nr:pantetheine-phosphate adenylyltransferase [Burkholderiales bacterium]
MPTLVRAVFPGTFDPITLGHEDMLRRACALFGEVIVAVAMAHHKKTLFTLDERLSITRQALADMPKVRVEPFEGLVTEFAVAHHAQVMVRGLRSGTDFDYELQLASMNRHLRP